MMTIKRLGALFTLLIIWGALIAEGQGAHASEQMEFSAEDSAVKRPVPIPADVLAVLKKDSLVRAVLENENIPAEQVPMSWFSASAIHLSKSRKADIVVVAEEKLAGANVDTFWVFRGTAHGHELVLTAPAHDLKVENTRWHGYRDITLVSATAVEVTTVWCRFDGTKYTEYKSTTEPIQ